MNTLQEMRDVIDAAIAGKVIQYECDGEWKNLNKPSPGLPHIGFNFINWKYRVKPEPKPDVVMLTLLQRNVCTATNRTIALLLLNWHEQPNIKLTFDGETGELKSAEVIKP